MPDTINVTFEEVTVNAQLSEETINVSFPVETINATLDEVTINATIGNDTINVTLDQVQDLSTYSTLNGVDTTFTYAGGVLTGLSTALGTKTFNYTSGKLTSITGTGIYKNKTFTYSGEDLVSVDVVE